MDAGYSYWNLYLWNLNKANDCGKAISKFSLCWIPLQTLSSRGSEAREAVDGSRISQNKCASCGVSTGLSISLAISLCLHRRPLFSSASPQGSDSQLMMISPHSTQLPLGTLITKAFDFCMHAMPLTSLFPGQTSPERQIHPSNQSVC